MYIVIMALSLLKYLDRELLKGEFCTLWFSKTNLYEKQNDTCWLSSKGALLCNRHVNYVKHLQILLFT